MNSVSEHGDSIIEWIGRTSSEIELKYSIVNIKSHSIIEYFSSISELVLQIHSTSELPSSGIEFILW